MSDNSPGNLVCIGTCGDCGGPVVVAKCAGWDDPQFGWCERCGHKPRIEIEPVFGPIIEMRAPDGPLASSALA